ncbi:MAG: TetR/AcrR family transcriptional regulator [Hyphomicrobiales bacterium]
MVDGKVPKRRDASPAPLQRTLRFFARIMVQRGTQKISAHAGRALRKVLPTLHKGRVALISEGVTLLVGAQRTAPIALLGRMRDNAAMDWNTADPAKRRGYHHGNLREALIDAALGLIAEKGAAALAMAEIARAAGVSAAAPYRHFKDRDDLLADIAKRGYQSFGAALSAAWDNGRPDARSGLIRVGRAYLDFARKNPAFYKTMFESGVAIGSRPDLRFIADSAFEILRAACDAVVADLPSGKSPPALMVALHIWAQAHGIASLFGTGNKGGRVVPMSSEDLLEASLLIYLDGIRSDLNN